MTEIIVQIYGILTPEDGLMVAELGADHIGVVVGEQQRTPDEVDFATAQDIFAAVPARTVKVGLTVATDLNEIVTMAQAVQPDILHLSSDLTAPTIAEVGELRERLPGLPLMRAISVDGPPAVAAALAWQEVSEYLLLDTKSSAETVIGATGHTHDWQISREIVAKTRIPVILAGGLSPENVAEAIQVVRPWGVDSLTHTNLPGRPIRKDPARVKKFIEAARSVV